MKFVHPIQSLVHNDNNFYELRYRRMGHFHYKVLPILREIVTGLLEFNIEQQ